MKKNIIILFFLPPFLLKAQYGKEVEAIGSQQLFVFLGSLPPSNGTNLQKMKVEILGCAWESYQTGETVFYILNRSELMITRFTSEGLFHQYSLHSYNNQNGNIDFYLITDSWTAMAAKSCMLIGGATQLITNTVIEVLPSGLVEIAPLNIRPVQTSDHDGNMATPDGNYKLSVNGKIRIIEVRVDAINWPDYVFQEGYDVGMLKGLESYIKTNKRLPEMPSAKEIEANGLGVGEMLKLQQKKIEELTLHLIEKDKQLQNEASMTRSSKYKIKELKNGYLELELLVKQEKVESINWPDYVSKEGYNVGALKDWKVILTLINICREYRPLKQSKAWNRTGRDEQPLW
ncbi:hypothetical protein ACUN24_13415 [Pedobacter sp. WC2501]|uniref:hypothetical protein n=1 Tax=Pedobacter sp. WC2501 TaxID=3461400 RepID=UPI004045241C